MLHAVKNGKDANEILAMPYQYLLQLLENEAEGTYLTDEEQDALLAAL
ncbi:phage tail assembly chaperone GT [Macrococcus bovicus]|nr:hypothetical protein [Macrococcus bovicus]